MYVLFSSNIIAVSSLENHKDWLTDFLTFGRFLAIHHFTSCTGQKYVFSVEYYKLTFLLHFFIILEHITTKITSFALKILISRQVQ